MGSAFSAASIFETYRPQESEQLADPDPLGSGRAAGWPQGGPNRL